MKKNDEKTMKKRWKNDEKTMKKYRWKFSAFFHRVFFLSKIRVFEYLKTLFQDPVLANFLFMIFRWCPRPQRQISIKIQDVAFLDYAQPVSVVAYCKAEGPEGGEMVTLDCNVLTKPNKIIKNNRISKNITENKKYIFKKSRKYCFKDF